METAQDKYRKLVEAEDQARTELENTTRTALAGVVTNIEDVAAAAADTRSSLAVQGRALCVQDKLPALIPCRVAKVLQKHSKGAKVIDEECRVQYAALLPELQKAREKAAKTAVKRLAKERGVLDDEAMKLLFSGGPYGPKDAELTGAVNMIAECQKRTGPVRQVMVLDTLTLDQAGKFVQTHHLATLTPLLETIHELLSGPPPKSVTWPQRRNSLDRESLKPGQKIELGTTPATV